MHIAYYSPTWPAAGASNGIVTYVAAMRRQLLAEGHMVSIVSQGKLHTCDGNVYTLDEAPVPRTWWSRLRGRIERDRGDHPAAASRLAGQLQRAQLLARFDLLEMEESFGWSRIAQSRLKVPVVTRLHGPQFLRTERIGTAFQHRQRRQRIAAEQRGFRDAQALSAPTQATMTAAITHYAHHPAVSAIILNPVTTDGDTATRWRSCEGSGGFVLFVGRFDRMKGADTMLQAFAQVVAKRPDARLVMVGPDEGLVQPDGGRMHFYDYARQCLDPTVRARIQFTGTLPKERIAALRQRSAMTVVASRHETFHYAAVEAMAAGSPVISTAWHGSDEVIDDGVTGWLTPVGDVDRLAERINWLFDHPEAAAEAGAAAWQVCRNRFAPEQVCRASIAFYDQVLARHADGR